MKAIVAKSYGGPEVLELKTVPIPEIKDNEILVKVETAAITTADTMMRTGKPYLARLVLGLSAPKDPIPGTGFSGYVCAIGAKVSKFKIGEAVFGETTLNFSASAEYLKIPQTGVIHSKPENLSHAEAAAFCDGPLTSYNFLKKLAQLEAGQKVLINGAAGALGVAAVQIAKTFGAEVTAVASAHNAPKLKAMGADHFIDYHQEDFSNGPKKYDLIFDTVGKSSFAKTRKVLKPQGQYLSPVLKFSLLCDMLSGRLFNRGQRAQFAATGALKDAELNAMLQEVLQIQQAGKLSVPIDRQYPLEKLAEAHAFISSGLKKFNLILRVA